MGQNLELAAKKGVTACMNRKKKQDCPYPKGSASRKAWNFGYDKIKEEK